MFYMCWSLFKQYIYAYVSVIPVFICYFFLCCLQFMYHFYVWFLFVSCYCLLLFIYVSCYCNCCFSVFYVSCVLFVVVRFLNCVWRVWLLFVCSSFCFFIMCSLLRCCSLRLCCGILLRFDFCCVWCSLVVFSHVVVVSV